MKNPGALDARTEEILVDYFLNVYDEVDDPEGALGELIGSREKALAWISAWQQLMRTDLAKFRRCYGPEIGARSMRAWLREVAPSLLRETVSVSRIRSAHVHHGLPERELRDSLARSYTDKFSAGAHPSEMYLASLAREKAQLEKLLALANERLADAEQLILINEQIVKRGWSYHDVSNEVADFGPDYIGFVGTEQERAAAMSSKAAAHL